MATKLKNLHLTKVDVVDEGANQHADIVLAKAKDADADDPDQEEVGLFKRFLAWLKGEQAEEDVKKTATSFAQQLNSSSLEEIMDETWDVCYALRNSIQSILADVEMEAAAKQLALAESVDQFATAVNGFAVKWTTGKTAGIKKSAEPELPTLQNDCERLEKMIAKAKEQKGDLEEMRKIDKSKMTAEEKAAYEAMVEKYAVEVDEPEDVAKGAGDPDPEEDDVVDDDVEKSKASKPEEKTDSADVYKSIIAGLKGDIEKMKDEMLTKELEAVAKKYEALGKKQEEIIDTLKKAKKAGVYDDIISAYDAALEAQNASGLFGEIGKSREGSDDGDAAAVQKASAAVAELKKSNPGLTDAQALDQVLLNNPELMKEFDQ